MLRVIAGAEYKLKYAGSALGYVWSVVEAARAVHDPLRGLQPRLQSSAASSHYYPLSLLIGIVLFNFFADATSLGHVVARRARVAAAEAELPAPRHPDRRRR